MSHVLARAVDHGHVACHAVAVMAVLCLLVSIAALLVSVFGVMYAMRTQTAVVQPLLRSWVKTDDPDRIALMLANDGVGPATLLDCSIGGRALGTDLAEALSIDPGLEMLLRKRRVRTARIGERSTLGNGKAIELIGVDTTLLDHNERYHAFRSLNNFPLVLHYQTIRGRKGLHRLLT